MSPKMVHQRIRIKCDLSTVINESLFKWVTISAIMTILLEMFVGFDLFTVITDNLYKWMALSAIMTIWITFSPDYTNKHYMFGRTKIYSILESMVISISAKLFYNTTHQKFLTEKEGSWKLNLVENVS